MPDAVVVGAGPNGLTAAVRIARQGFTVTVLEAADTIGGGTRTAELTVAGVLHDRCSAVHPFGVASPYLATLPLESFGLSWAWPEVDLAHPLDDGTAGVVVQSLPATAAGLGTDGPAWRAAFAPLAENFGALSQDLLRPVLHIPRHPVKVARFGLGALQPATWFARRWQTDAARALFAGACAHAFQPLERPTTAAIGLMLLAAGHHAGWPVARGGSRTVTDALAGLLTSLGGTIETGVRVTSLAELPPSKVTLLDVAPSAALAICGDVLPDRVRHAYRRYRHGPAASKVDLAVEGGVPWTAEPPRRAGTVHLGGTIEEIAAVERDVHAGRMPARPFVLVGQQYLADPSRSAGDVHPVWAYAHVPHGWSGDAAEAVVGQIERFAPGFRDRIVATHVTPPAQLARDNPNDVGGDIAGGANTPRQLLLRPRLALDPYWTGIPGVFLCSASTPPGAGVHGMCGYHAATAACKVLMV